MKRGTGIAGDPAWKLANRDGKGKTAGRGGVARIANVIISVVNGFTHPGTARRVTYVLTDRDDPETRTYATKDDLDDVVGRTITVLRDAGYIHPDLIVDGRSTVEKPNPMDDPADFLQRIIDNLDDDYVHDRQERQPRRIVLSAETADTLPGLRRLAHRYGCLMVSSSGTSTDQQRMNLGRILVDERRPITVLYVGDYDPPGLSMADQIGTAVETWAARWWVYNTLIENPDEFPPNVAYRIACQFFPRRLPGESWHDPGAGGVQVGSAAVAPRWVDVEVVQVAITADDLDGRTCKPVKPDQAERYRRWWPEGETRTLQVEALSIEELEDRVEQAILDRLDTEAYDAVIDSEDEPRQLLRDALTAALAAVTDPGAGGPE